MFRGVRCTGPFLQRRNVGVEIKKWKYNRSFMAVKPLERPPSSHQILAKPLRLPEIRCVEGGVVKSIEECDPAPRPVAPTSSPFDSHAHP